MSKNTLEAQDLAVEAAADFIVSEDSREMKDTSETLQRESSHAVSGQSKQIDETHEQGTIQ